MTRLVNWVLLVAATAGPAALLYWVVTRYPGWPIADLAFSLIALGWLYWVTNRQQWHLDRIEALERKTRRNTSPAKARVPDPEPETAPIVMPPPDGPDTVESDPLDTWARKESAIARRVYHGQHRA